MFGTRRARSNRGGSAATYERIGEFFACFWCDKYVPSLPVGAAKSYAGQRCFEVSEVQR